MSNLKIVIKKGKYYQSASMDPEEELTSPKESDSCDVCRDPTTEEDNEIIYCDACNVCVHQACYGVETIPEGKWFCNPCEQNVSNPTCALCPNVGGAMKVTSGDLWAHVSCAMWIFEVEFLDKKNVDIIDISQVPKSRMTLRCSICRKMKGACIQCAVKKCYVAFHVTCGFDSPGTKMMQEDLPDSNQYIFKSFCTKHAKSQGKRQNRRKRNTKKSTESLSEYSNDKTSDTALQNEEQDGIQVDTTTSTEIKNHASFPNTSSTRLMETVNDVTKETIELPTETTNEVPAGSIYEVPTEAIYEVPTEAIYEVPTEPMNEVPTKTMNVRMETVEEIIVEDSSSSPLPDVQSLVNEDMESSSLKVKVMKARKSFAGPKKTNQNKVEDDTLIVKNLQPISETESSEFIVSDKKEQSPTQSMLERPFSILSSDETVSTVKVHSSSSQEEQEISAQNKKKSPTVTSKRQKYSNKNKAATSKIGTSSEPIASQIELPELSETQPATFERKHEPHSEKNKNLTNTFLSDDQSTGERIEDVIAFLAGGHETKSVEPAPLDFATQIPGTSAKKEVVEEPPVKYNRTQVEQNGIQSPSFADNGQTKERKKKLLSVTANGKKRPSSDLTNKHTSIPEAKKIKTAKNLSTASEKGKKPANKSSTPAVRRVSLSSVSSNNIPEIPRDSLNIFLRYVESLLRPVPHNKSLKVQKEIIATIERELCDSSVESDSSK